MSKSSFNELPLTDTVNCLQLNPIVHSTGFVKPKFASRLRTNIDKPCRRRATYFDLAIEFRNKTMACFGYRNLCHSYKPVLE